jgi:hypothetical protein
MGCEVIPEDISNHGQADLTIGINNVRIIMEIKVLPSSASLTELPADGVGNPALAQIRKMDYASKYRELPGQQLFELGMVFGRAERGLIGFNWL